jgi:hypothetical protein
MLEVPASAIVLLSAASILCQSYPGIQSEPGDIENLRVVVKEFLAARIDRE